MRRADRCAVENLPLSFRVSFLRVQSAPIYLWQAQHRVDLSRPSALPYLLPRVVTGAAGKHKGRERERERNAVLS